MNKGKRRYGESLNAANEELFTFHHLSRDIKKHKSNRKPAAVLRSRAGGRSLKGVYFTAKDKKNKHVR